MTTENRNANVVVAVIGALTVGASVLLWLEPRPTSGDTAARGALLTAEAARPIEQLSIAYGRSLLDDERGSFDGVIHPNGELEWNPGSSAARVLVIGSGGDRLHQQQARTLLELVRWLNEHRGLDLRRVTLERSADARVTRGLPGEARELTTLLEMREIIR